ncbi:MAG TPA: transglycosylase SLT domain-containing protein [Gemmatimonadaceae bacterium]|nr:transglycosylase SLT domain-containing protein [Gemmatimonadaceae bacterium]
MRRAFPLLAAAVLGSACGRVQPVPAVTAVPVTAAPVDPAQDGRQLENNVAQQGYPRPDPAAAGPRMMEMPAPAPADASAVVIPPSDGPAWDIEVRSYESTARVTHYVNRFTGPARSYIEDRLSEGTRYESMIRDAMRAGGIPEDMYYLGLVESGFDPNAYSRAAAVGMWQFMSSTGRGMGLRVDWWMDERRDPVRSTKAAVKFLGGLREQFGSIYLAAAAYNGGPGRIARGLTQYADDLEGTAGDDLFFALADKQYLKNETREYVPQIIAAALIAKEPAKYGVSISPRPAWVYDSVKVPALTSLAAVARAAGVPVKAVKDLNPQILRGMAPPRDSAMLRIPVGTATRFDSAFAAIPDSLRRGAKVVRTKGTETAEKLAAMTKVQARRIPEFNRGLKRTKSGKYLAGQVVYVPTADAVEAATTVPDPSIERYGSYSTTGTHVVRKGENLSTIAKKYRTTTAKLMQLNRLKKSIIFPGQEILVSGKMAKPAAKKPVAKKKR